MKEITVIPLTHEKAEELMEELDRAGFVFDEDFAPQYGRGWGIIGVRTLNLPAQRAAVTILNWIEKA